MTTSEWGCKKGSVLFYRDIGQLSSRSVGRLQDHIRQNSVNLMYHFDEKYTCNSNLQVGIHVLLMCWVYCLILYADLSQKRKKMVFNLNLIHVC